MLQFIRKTKNIWMGPALVIATGISYTFYVENLLKIDPDMPTTFRPESVGKCTVCNDSVFKFLCILNDPDDMMASAMHTGDLILFDRKMTNRHVGFICHTCIPH